MDFISQITLFVQSPAGLVTSLCLLCFILTLAAWYYQFSYPAFGKTKRFTEPEVWPGVSIIICTQNEYNNLTSLLPALLSQQYPEFEVIVVDQASEDDTEILMAQFQYKYNNLVHRKITTDAKFGISKPIQMGVGIKAAKYEKVIFIHPDCMPVQGLWLQSLMKSYNRPGTGLVLGYTKFKNANKWVRLDFLLHQMHYMSRARHGMPYTGNDSYFSFDKSLFFEQKGFDPRISWQHSTSQALIGQLCKGRNTRGCILPEAVCTSGRTFTNAQWTRYRLLEINSIALASKIPFIPMLAENLVRLAYYILLAVAVCLLGFSPQSTLALGILGGSLLLRWISVELVLDGARRHFSEKGLGWIGIIWDIIAPFAGIYQAGMKIARSINH